MLFELDFSLKELTLRGLTSSLENVELRSEVSWELGSWIRPIFLPFPGTLEVPIGANTIKSHI